VRSHLEFLQKARELGLEVAWLKWRNELRYAVSRGARRDLGGAYHSGMHSAVVALIEDVYASEERWPLAWLRNRIWTTERIGVASRATVQVAARRICWDQGWDALFAELSGVGRAFDRVVSGPDPELDQLKEDPAEVLQSVTASICAEGGAPVRMARINQARRHRVRHAEVRLIRDWLGQPEMNRYSKPIEIHVSLKSCKMCAAWIFEALAGKCEFTVLFSQNDPGRLAQFTALEAGTPQRKEAVRLMGLGPEWVDRKIEAQLET